MENSEIIKWINSVMNLISVDQKSAYEILKELKERLENEIDNQVND